MFFLFSTLGLSFTFSLCVHLHRAVTYIYQSLDRDLTSGGVCLTLLRVRCAKHNGIRHSTLDFHVTPFATLYINDSSFFLFSLLCSEPDGQLPSPLLRKLPSRTTHEPSWRCLRIRLCFWHLNYLRKSSLPCSPTLLTPLTTRLQVHTHTTNLPQRCKFPVHTRSISVLIIT